MDRSAATGPQHDGTSPPSPSDGPAAEPPGDLGGLERLGSGGAEDRLSPRLLWRIAQRVLPLLQGLRRHLAGLLGGFALLTILLVPPGLLLFDLFWTRVLQGEPLTDFEALVLGLDPALWCAGEVLPTELRRELARRVVWIGAVIGVVGAPAGIGLYFYQVWILQKVNQKLRLDLLERLQALSLRFHSDQRVGDALYRLYQDSAMVTQVFELLLLAPLGAVARYLFGIAMVSLFDPALALLLALCWPPVLAIGWLCSRPMRMRFRRAREAQSRLTSRIQETLVGIRVIKAFGAEPFEQERFEESSLGAFREAFRARNYFAAFQIGIFATIAAGALLAIALATLRARETAPVALAVAGFSAWNLGLYNYFKLRVGDATTSTRILFKTWGRLQDVAIGLDRVFEVLDLEPEVQDAPDARPLEGVFQDVVFRDVRFAYQPESPVLDGVSLEAPVGSVTAVVGPTGSGKSTMMGLLLRLYDPEAGAIEIDGVDLRRFQVATLRERVSVALQENVLFGESIRENIRFAVPEADDAAVRAAARVACADGFIEALPLGYDTPLGERGAKLSTGQRQRLTIARAVLKDPTVLILDEPTAALDAATEIAVLRNLAEWGQGRVLFLITHRLSTIRRADQIAFLRAGRVEELGSHQELMQREAGGYRRLVETEMLAASRGLDQAS